MIGSCFGRKINVEPMNAAEQTTVNRATDFAERIPAGICRPAVRGFPASIPASTSRLKAIAADRAKTMQSRIPTRSCQRKTVSGRNHAMVADNRAKGRANTVWLKRISSRSWRIRSPSPEGGVCVFGDVAALTVQLLDCGCGIVQKDYDSEFNLCLIRKTKVIVMIVHDCISNVTIWCLNDNRMAIDHCDSKQRNSTADDHDGSRGPSCRN